MNVIELIITCTMV